MPGAPTNFTLEVDRLVQHPLILRVNELLGMPATEGVSVTIVSRMVGVASWRGVRVGEIARLALLDTRVKYVEFRSFDNGYWSGGTWLALCFLRLC